MVKEHGKAWAPTLTKLEHISLDFPLHTFSGSLSLQLFAFATSHSPLPSPGRSSPPFFTTPTCLSLPGGPPVTERQACFRRQPNYGLQPSNHRL
uniref:Uncharacterized protein n=1 Tax=Steinernema glaseri TaxID=37863 RepID=A0A1I7XYV0_9BILA